MSCLKHGHSAERWIDFLDGRLDPHAADRMNKDIGECSHCRAIYEDLRLSRARLEEWNASLALDPGATEASEARMHRAIMARIRMSQAAAAGQAIAAGVRELRAILEPICGSATTEGAIQSAVRQCNAASIDQLQGSQWEPFVGRLGSTIDAICGAAVALWIREITRGIQWEAGT